MNHPTPSPLWVTLLEAGLVEDPPPTTRELDSPWYVKVLLAFSGWLAALCLFAFIGMTFKALILDSVIAFITGSFLLAIAIGVLRLPKKEFYEHLAIATSLTGQALLIFALINYIEEVNEVVWLLVALLQIALLFVIPNYIHRVFSAYFAVVALTVLMLTIGMSFIFSIALVFTTCWLWLNEFRYPRHMKMTQAIGYGLLLAMGQLNAAVLIFYFNFNLGSQFTHLEIWDHPWIQEIPITVSMLYVVWHQLKRNRHLITEPFSILLLLGALIINIISMEVTGLNEGILVLLLGYAGSNRVILGLGIITLLHNIASYYFFLDTTLLVKSQILFVTGLFLLASRWLLLRWLPKKGN